MSAALRVGTLAFLLYVTLHATSSAVLAAASIWRLRHGRRWSLDHRAAVADPDAPGVSVVVPARNEASCVVQTVRSLRTSAYRGVEVVVVDDGSTDGTFEALAGAFGLAPRRFVDVPVPDLDVRGRVLGVHADRSGRLLVVRKNSSGSKADALNAGVNVSSREVVCVVDADAVLDHDAIARLVAPFTTSARRVVATGGALRIANGIEISNGQATGRRRPVRWLVRMQEVEYLRAFALSRPGWSAARCLPLISGAFGAFDRSALVAVGGFDADAIGEDLDVVARLHRWARSCDPPAQLVHVADATCWTHVPERVRDLAVQRRRWGRGLAEVLRANRRAIGRPTEGRFGVLTLPYLVLLELLGPVVEVLGGLATVLALATGTVEPGPVVGLAVAATLAGVALSLVAVLVEAGARMHGGPRRVLALVTAAVLEPFGYRQRHAVWRIAGAWQALARRPVRWGARVEGCAPG